jgi:hypothetical protein
MTDQKAAGGPQERLGGGSATPSPPEGGDGAQAGDDGLDSHNAGPTVAECAEADRAYWTDKHAGDQP